MQLFGRLICDNPSNDRHSLHQLSRASLCVGVTLLLSALLAPSAWSLQENPSASAPPGAGPDVVDIIGRAFLMNELGQIAGTEGNGVFLWSDGVIKRIALGLPLGINNQGVVVGFDFNTEAPVIWDNGQLTHPLEAEVGAVGTAVAVNERGMVALWGFTPASADRSYLWNRGTLTDLGDLPGRSNTIASDLNARGQVVGVSGGHAFLWDRGIMTDLTPNFTVHSGFLPDPVCGCIPTIRINNRGQVVGRGSTQVPAFLWERGAPLTNLGSLGGGETEPADINEKGQVVGWSKTAAGETHAFFWERGVMTDLGTTGERSEAFGINERGQVVGRSGLGSEVAFIWEKGVRTDIVDLGTGRITALNLAINNRGQVMGTHPGLPPRPFLWERGTLTYLSGQVVAPGPGALIGPASVEVHTGIERALSGRRNVQPFSRAVVSVGVAQMLAAHSPLPARAEQESLADPKPPSAASESPVVDLAGHVLNELGQIAGRAGTTGFFWSKGVLTDIGLRPDAVLIFDINNSGMVVGYDGGPSALGPFLWQDGVRIDPLGGAGLWGGAFAVNERGMVALGLEVSGVFHAFLWERGTLTDLGVGLPVDINDRGQVVGLSALSGGHVVIWDRGAVTNLVGIDVEFSEPFLPLRINNRGQVIGPGFIWEKGKATNLGSPGAYEMYPRDINERGQVVGWNGTALGEIHAFLWEDGVMTDLGRGAAWGINERGQVVLSGDVPGSSVDHDIVWERGVRTNIVDQDGNPVRSNGPLAINNHGQVMGNDAARGPYLWERGHLTCVSGLVAASSIKESPTPRPVGTFGQESGAVPTAGLVPGDVRTLLGAPSPNPSTGAVEFAVRLDRDDAVSISLYDAAGRLVASRAPEHLAAGSHALRWDPGVQKAGLYFARMETASGGAVIRRWVIIR